MVAISWLQLSFMNQIYCLFYERRNLQLHGKNCDFKREKKILAVTLTVTMVIILPTMKFLKCLVSYICAWPCIQGYSLTV